MFGVPESAVEADEVVHLEPVGPREGVIRGVREMEDPPMVFGRGVFHFRVGSKA